MDASKKPHLLLRLTAVLTGGIAGFFGGFWAALLPCINYLSGMYCNPHGGLGIFTGLILGLTGAFLLGRYFLALLCRFYNRNRNTINSENSNEM